jgi:hypothetical protein
MNFQSAVRELCINRSDVRELARTHHLNAEQVSALSAVSQKLASSSAMTMSSAFSGMMIM